MKVLEVIIRVLQSPFFMIGQLFGAIGWCLVSWFRFVCFGGEFIWYINGNERKTISDVYDELNELRDENPS